VRADDTSDGRQISGTSKMFFIGRVQSGSASIYRLLNLYANEKQRSRLLCLSFTISITKHVSADVNEMLHDALASDFGITLQ
jgi:hypothetical protein